MDSYFPKWSTRPQERRSAARQGAAHKGANRYPIFPKLTKFRIPNFLQEIKNRK